jgi:coenzyme PQQ precursor peptide PqqA
MGEVVKIPRSTGKQAFDGCSSAVIAYIELLAPGRTGACRAIEGNDAMAWSTPEVREVCAGMEVTSYLSAEM